MPESPQSFGMLIDSHQHFWIYDRAEYPWIRDDPPVLKRDYLPPDLLPELEACRLDGAVAVQARQTLEESRWLLRLADEHPLVKGVVGWVDLQSNDCGAQLEELARHPRFSGVRHVVQDELDDNFMLRPAFIRGIEQLEQFKLTYDLLVFPKQLPAAIALAHKFPRQKFVLDHIAKPLIRDAVISPWDSQIRELAKAPNVFCKISGMVTEAKHRAWNPDDFKPYMDIVLEAFGEDRLMYGSDWPVCLLSGSYQQVFDIVSDYLSQFSAETRRKILGRNAIVFYELEL
jgi:L-fuconolactonase